MWRIAGRIIIFMQKRDTHSEYMITEYLEDRSTTYRSLVMLAVSNNPFIFHRDEGRSALFYDLPIKNYKRVPSESSILKVLSNFRS